MREFMNDQDNTLSGEALYEKIKHLTEVKVDSTSWQIFYLDTVTSEKWVQEYPQSESHGGGPPILRLIDKFPWE
jgi:hypothetical protein